MIQQNYFQYLFKFLLEILAKLVFLCINQQTSNPYFFLNTRSILQCNKQLLLLNTERHIRDSYTRRIGDQRCPENLRDSTCLFSSTGMTQFSKGVTASYHLHISTRCVACLAMKVPFVVAIIVKNVDSQRVLYLVSRCIVHMQVYEGKRKEIEAVCFKAPPESQRRDIRGWKFHNLSSAQCGLKMPEWSNQAFAIPGKRRSFFIFVPDTMRRTGGENRLNLSRPPAWSPSYLVSEAPLADQQFVLLDTFVCKS